MKYCLCGENCNRKRGYKLCCRICLLSNCKLLSLESYGLSGAYEQLTGVTLEHDDGLPRELCVECATLLDKYHKFRDKSIRGNSLLRQLHVANGTITLEKNYDIDRSLYGLTSKLTYQRQIVCLFLNTNTSEVNESDLVKEENFIENFVKNDGFYSDNGTEIKVKDENKDKDSFDLDEDLNESLLTPSNENNDNFSDSSDNLPLKTKITKNNKPKSTRIKTNKRKNRNVPKDKEKPLSNRDKLNQANVKLLNKHFKVTELSLEEQLQVHEDKKNKDNYICNEFKCEICYKGYQNEMSFKTHMNLHSQEKGEHCCLICKRRFPSRFQMIGHHRITHQFKYECLYCSEVFIRRYAAIIHAKWHEGNNFPCEQCGATYQKKTSLLTHVRIKHPSNNACSYCGLSYLGEKGLEAHINLRHGEHAQIPIDGPWCTDCGIQFVSVEALQVHNGVKHTPSDKTKRNETKYPNAVLNTAVKQKRKKEFPVPCEACGQEMRDGREYYHHFRNQHPDKSRTTYTSVVKKQHMCDKCSRRFSSKTHLREHLLEHGEDTPYKCDKCPKCYKNSLKLKAHLRTHEQPKYECPVCGKMFTTKYNRDKHYKYVHPNSDLQKWKCEICFKDFQSKWTLHFHNKHVHQNVPWPKRNRNKNNTTIDL